MHSRSGEPYENEPLQAYALIQPLFLDVALTPRRRQLFAKENRRSPLPPPCKPLCVSSPLHFSSISQFVFLSCANNTSRKRYYYFFLLLITLLNFNFDPSFSGREGARRGGIALQKQNIFMAGFGDPKLIRPEESNADRLILYTAELFMVQDDQQLL